MELQQIRLRQEIAEHRSDNAAPSTKQQWGGQRPRGQDPPRHNDGGLTNNTALDNKYWKDRQCAKFSPVVPETGGELRDAAVEFMRTKLLVGCEDVEDDDITNVRRIKSIRGAAPGDEVLVVFKDIETRDLVCSHARNLADQQIKPGG